MNQFYNEKKRKEATSANHKPLYTHGDTHQNERDHSLWQNNNNKKKRRKIKED